MGKKLDEFQANRSEMNEKLIGSNNINIKRFFALDERAYADGVLSHKTKNSWACPRLWSLAVTTVSPIIFCSAMKRG